MNKPISKFYTLSITCLFLLAVSWCSFLIYFSTASLDTYRSIDQYNKMTGAVVIITTLLSSIGSVFSTISYYRSDKLTKTLVMLAINLGIFASIIIFFSLIFLIMIFL